MKNQRDGAAYSSSIIDMVADVTSAYVATNSIPAANLSDLISGLHGVFTRLYANEPASGASENDKPTPPLSQIVSKDSICCLECGRHFSSLVRHLTEAHQTSADAYRQKWRLPRGFPMISPALAQIRSRNAKSLGLGKRERSAAVS